MKIAVNTSIPTDFMSINKQAARTLFAVRGYLHLYNIPTDLDYLAFADNDLGFGPIRPQPNGEPFTIVQPKIGYENRSDSRTAGSIPPHTDGPWLEDPMGALLLYCENPGDVITPTILHDTYQFIDDGLPIPMLNKAVAHNVHWINDFSDCKSAYPVLSMKENSLIVRWSQNIALLGESSPDARLSEQAFQHAVCGDFVYALAALYRQWSSKEKNQLHVRLKKGECVIFNNLRFTHEVHGGKSPNRRLVRVFLNGMV